LITVYKHENGSTEIINQVDPSFLAAALRPGSGIWLWVDLAGPTAAEAQILTDVFHFHELAIEDALAEIHNPKVESYGTFLYLILHAIDFRAREHAFRTQEVDFFLGENYLVTMHAGTSRSIGRIGEICSRNERVLGEGPAALLHRIIDAMVDHYRPEVDKLGDRLDALEKEVFQGPKHTLVKRILDYKRDIASLRRVVLPQRDAVSRLARREFVQISESLSYRFRDVHDHLVRLADEAIYFHDRISSLLEAHLSNVSNQLNGIMKVLTIISTVFMPLTVLTGAYGMNVPLPHLPGGNDAQFWWIVGIMLSVTFTMLWFFKRKGWI
jgi:magnesium transporter